MDNAELRAAVISYMQIADSSFDAALPLMINRTQARLRSLRVPEKEVRIHGSVPQVVLPTDVEEIKEVWSQSPRNPDTDVYDADYPESIYPHLIATSWQRLSGRSDSGGYPSLYTRRKTEAGADVLQIWPGSGNFNIEVTYYQNQPELVNVTDTYVYTTYFSDLMIFGTVAVGYRWLRSEDQMGIWEASFQNLYQEIEDAGFNRDYRGSTPITGNPYAANINVY